MCKTTNTSPDKTIVEDDVDEIEPGEMPYEPFIEKHDVVMQTPSSGDSIFSDALVGGSPMFNDATDATDECFKILEGLENDHALLQDILLQVVEEGGLTRQDEDLLFRAIGVDSKHKSKKSDILHAVNREMLECQEEQYADELVKEGDVQRESGVEVDEKEVDEDDNIKSLLANAAKVPALNNLIEQSKYIPLRLTFEERKFLRLLESTLQICEYTDKVDNIALLPPSNNKNKKLEDKLQHKRMATQVKQVCAVLTGIALASHERTSGNISEAREIKDAILRERDFAGYQELYQTIFEIGRRYKILNPERMRESYGKMIYFLQDSVNEDISELLEFSLITPPRSVFQTLQHKRARNPEASVSKKNGGKVRESTFNGLHILLDPLTSTATKEIMPENKSRGTIQKEIKEKEAAIKTICQRYACIRRRTKPNRYGYHIHGRVIGNLYDDISSEDDATSDQARREYLTTDDIEQCLYSLGDRNTYLRFNQEPCDKMIKYLNKYFKPGKIETTKNGIMHSLAIVSGEDGARLTHSHERQYAFVLQSLTLWREVLGDIFRLWNLAEEDLLDVNKQYVLTDTGQGVNRLQPAPRISSAMYAILAKVQKQVGGWIGSSKIHLGDYNVPNALIFIDKYIQIPRILTPVTTVLDQLPDLVLKNPSIKAMVEEDFGGSCDSLIKIILSDFFRHAFDGSGGDNFFEAGSCIDGRLTSAWNWCSTIAQKPYYPLFQLTGTFVGFDGKF